jgi:hypothetical protein
MEMERGGWGGGETERGRCSIGGVSEEMQRLLLQLPRHHDADVSGEGMSSLVKVSPEDIVAGSRVPEEVGVEGMKLGDEEKGKVRGGEEEEEDEGEGMEVKFGEAFSPRGQEALPFIQEQALNKGNTPWVKYPECYPQFTSTKYLAFVLLLQRNNKYTHLF